MARTATTFYAAVMSILSEAGYDWQSPFVVMELDPNDSTDIDVGEVNGTILGEDVEASDYYLQVVEEGWGDYTAAVGADNIEDGPAGYILVCHNETGAIDRIYFWVKGD